MRKILLLALVALWCMPMHVLALKSNLPSSHFDEIISGSAFNPSHDTLRDRAIILLEKHMQQLKNLKEMSGQYKAGFIKGNPTVPCDYCAGGEQVELSNYVSTILAPGKYPNGMIFTYERIEKYDEIDVTEIEIGHYRIQMNVKKTIQGIMGSDNVVNPQKTRTSFLKYEFELNYNKNIMGIRILEEQKAPGINMLVLELNPNVRLTSPDYSNQEVFDVSSTSGLLIKAGAVYYFNPFKGVNKTNLWLKSGLRLSYMSTRLTSDLLDFRQREVDLDGGTVFNPHLIDLRYDVNNLTERITAVGIEIPLGVSKRIAIDNKKELSLEVELSYTYEVVKQVGGDFLVDLTGTNHFFNNDIQSASGGSPVEYQSTPQAVLTAAGEVVGFSRGNEGSLNQTEVQQFGFLTFSFRPSLFLKKYDKIRYQIGLNFSYLGLPTNPFGVDQTYFEPSRIAREAPLHDVDQKTGHFFAGIFFGFKL